ncbi:MAG: hypothetical protein KAJ95_09405 [Gammaproteobacteria bacterium]|nr:hypothetical protein [Gammaproteobacteria bacterium]
MFINAIAVFGRQLHIRSIMNWQSNSVSLLTIVIVLFTVPAWSQGDSDYLKAMDKASGKKEQPSNVIPATTINKEVKLIDSDTRDELEALLAETCPKEFSTYKKFNAARKNEVVASYKATDGQPEKVRVMKVINKIGLIGSGEGWDF